MAEIVKFDPGKLINVWRATEAIKSQVEPLINRYVKQNPDATIAIETKARGVPWQPVPFGYNQLYADEDMRVIVRPGKATKKELMLRAVQKFAPPVILGMILGYGIAYLTGR